MNTAKNFARALIFGVVMLLTFEVILPLLHSAKDIGAVIENVNKLSSGKLFYYFCSGVLFVLMHYFYEKN